MADGYFVFKYAGDKKVANIINEWKVRGSAAYNIRAAVKDRYAVLNKGSKMDTYFSKGGRLSTMPDIWTEEWRPEDFAKFPIEDVLKMRLQLERQYGACCRYVSSIATLR